MKTLDKGKDRVEKIVKVLREETLEPAKEEAQRIIDEAKAEAERIVKAAERALHAGIPADAGEALLEVPD